MGATLSPGKKIHARRLVCGQLVPVVMSNIAMTVWTILKREGINQPGRDRGGIQRRQIKL
jgi:hypothetical protein